MTPAEHDCSKATTPVSALHKRPQRALSISLSWATQIRLCSRRRRAVTSAACSLSACCSGAGCCGCWERGGTCLSQLLCCPAVGRHLQARVFRPVGSALVLRVVSWQGLWAPDSGCNWHSPLQRAARVWALRVLVEAGLLLACHWEEGKGAAVRNSFAERGTLLQLAISWASVRFRLWISEYTWVRMATMQPQTWGRIIIQSHQTLSKEVNSYFRKKKEKKNLRQNPSKPNLFAFKHLK